MEKILYRCKGNKMFQEGHLLGRKDCGQDLSEQMESVARDAKIHTLECPYCGNVAKVCRMPE